MSNLRPMTGNLRPLPEPVDGQKLNDLMRALYARSDVDALARLGFEPSEITAIARVARAHDVRLSQLVRGMVSASLEAMGERLD